MFKQLIAAAGIAATSLFAPVMAADATAVVFWAEWCGACKILDPVLDKAVASYDEAEIEIYRFDYSSPEWSALEPQFATAEAKGFAPFIEIGTVKTGFAKIIVDGEEKGRLTAGMTEEMMHAAFTKALQD